MADTAAAAEAAISAASLSEMFAQQKQLFGQFFQQLMYEEIHNFAQQARIYPYPCLACSNLSPGLFCLLVSVAELSSGSSF